MSMAQRTLTKIDKVRDRETEERDHHNNHDENNKTTDKQKSVKVHCGEWREYGSTHRGRERERLLLNPTSSREY